MTEAALPLLLKANTEWIGNDGNWSTFSIGVGTPHQIFDALPSTAAGEIWVPLPEGCSTSIPNCAASRGIVSSQTGGFLSNESSTWELIGSGIYGLGFEAGLFGGENGLYGQDVVSVGNGTYTVSNQTVAGFTTGDFWLSSLGLGVQGSSFGPGESNLPTLLTSLKAQNLTTSLSYGYAAGSFHRSSPGSLVLGGYDANAFEGDNMTFPAFYSGARSLTVNLRSLLASNTLQGYSSVPIEAGGLNISIDSTVSQIWLPEVMCDSLAESLGLTYDNSTDLYLVNTTSRGQLMTKGTSFTFAIASGSTGGSLNIEIPWTAFDFSYGAPLYSEYTPYFPMRRAANATQYVLGRAFLQEAYLVVDWERMTFTLGQSAQGTSTSTSTNIVPILPIGFATTPMGAPKITDTSGQSTSKSSKSEAGMYAGVAVGVIAAIVIVCGAFWYIRRNKSRRESNAVSDTAVTEHFPEDKDSKLPQEYFQEAPGSPPPPGYHEMPSPPVKPEFDHTPIHELGGEARHHLMSTPVYELPAAIVGHEIGDSTDVREVSEYPFPQDVIEPAESTS